MGAVTPVAAASRPVTTGPRGVLAVSTRPQLPARAPAPDPGRLAGPGPMARAEKAGRVARRGGSR